MTVASTDVTVTCPCCGASRSVSARQAKRLSRLPSPDHERVLHELASVKTSPVRGRRVTT